MHLLERWRAQRAEKEGLGELEPWEGKGTFLYHMELGTDVLMHTLTLAHYAHLW